MRNPLALFAGAALCFSSCHTKQTSTVWRQVVEVPHPGGDTMDSSRAYAADLHRVLLQSRVPHKIVTVSFSFRTDYTSSATTQRTLVVYQDTSTPKGGWWVMDERLNVPVWLPDKPLEQQVSFYLARPATLLDVSDFTNPQDGKSVIPLEKARPPQSGVSTIEPVTPRVVEPVRRRSSGKKSPASVRKPSVPVSKPAAKPKASAEPSGSDASSASAPKVKPVKPAAKRPGGAVAPSASEKLSERPAANNLPKVEAKSEPLALGSGSGLTAASEKKKDAVEAKNKASKNPPVVRKEPPNLDPPSLQDASRPESPPVEKEAAPPAAPGEPSSKADPSEESPLKRPLSDKAEQTPPAAEGQKSDEKKAPPVTPAADTPKPAEPPKTTLLKRWFRKVFRA